MKNIYLDQKLIEYSNSDTYPFHMPGHKRRPLDQWYPESLDITEIHDFDNLHHAEGILAEGQKRLAACFGADESCYLVNGSTAGLLSAICGCTKKGDSILAARNCHKAVYHALYLNELQADYLMPERTVYGIQGSILPATVKHALTGNPDIKAVVITSPTYDGVISDIESIAKIVHEYKIPLIVDEAHGAHFGFSRLFPAKAHTLGADLVIESLHKTLPSFTQTAVIHFADSPYVDRERVKRYLGMYQTSSPSYLFMAGMDRCVRLLSEQGEGLFADFEQRLLDFYEKCRKFPCIKVPDSRNTETKEPAENRNETSIYRRDLSKILISAAGIGLSGPQLMDILRERYRLELEMASGEYATALTSIMDTGEGFDRLWQALVELDALGIDGNKEVTQMPDTSKNSPRESICPDQLYQSREKVMEISRAMDAEWESIPIEETAGRISAEFIYLYPPGIPIIVPGEKLTGSAIEQIRTCRTKGMEINGPVDLEGRYLRCVKSLSD